jgi:hypothetical protein
MLKVSVKTSVTIEGESSYSELFSRYSSLRKSYSPDSISVFCQWPSRRLEAQYLFGVWRSLALSVRLVDPGDLDMFHNPRHPVYRVGTVAAFHKRYALNETSLKEGDFSSWDELLDYITSPVDSEEGGLGAVVALPVYMLDHSGLRFSTSSFNCSWDSGQIGYIYMGEEEFSSGEYGAPGEAEKALTVAVELWDKWSTGEMYEAVLHKGPIEDEEYLDFVSGYFFEGRAQADGEGLLATHKSEALSAAVAEKEKNSNAWL